jgi:peptidoglycan/xylan/chitin deacetylase (PgdA/CDA1 family)
VPAGKHPVILSFDDATASQFHWSPRGDDVRVIDPDSAMGVLEGFFRQHPDFGRGGQFAVLTYNCFADGTPLNTIEDCPDKLRWMAANGYEIVNHTAGHQDLFDVSDEEFMYQLGDPILWLEGIIQGDANMMDVLVMPYGNYPSRDLHPEQREMLRDGFSFEGRDVRIRAAFMVGANPTESPSSAEYDPLFIARIQAHAESLDGWFGAFENGSVPLYVSDGDPDTITLPAPLPDSLAHHYDAGAIAAGGHRIFRYDPATGEPVEPGESSHAHAAGG